MPSRKSQREEKKGEEREEEEYEMSCLKYLHKQQNNMDWVAEETHSAGKIIAKKEEAKWIKREKREWAEK